MLIGDGLFTSADMITIRSFLMTGNIWTVLGSVLRHRGQIASFLCSVVLPLWWQQQDYISYVVMYWMCVSVCLCPCVSPDQSGRRSWRKCLRADQTPFAIIARSGLHCYWHIHNGIHAILNKWSDSLTVLSSLFGKQASCFKLVSVFVNSLKAICRGQVLLTDRTRWYSTCWGWKEEDRRDAEVWINRK